MANTFLASIPLPCHGSRLPSSHRAPLASHSEAPLPALPHGFLAWFLNGSREISSPPTRLRRRPIPWKAPSEGIGPWPMILSTAATPLWKRQATIGDRLTSHTDRSIRIRVVCSSFARSASSNATGRSMTRITPSRVVSIVSSPRQGKSPSMALEANNSPFKMAVSLRTVSSSIIGRSKRTTCIFYA